VNCLTEPRANDKEVTLTSDNLLSTKIISVYRNNPNISRKVLAEIVGAKYGTVRNVVSHYVRMQVTGRQRPRPELPFSFHGFYWSGLWKSELYGVCPAGVVANRNGMKRFVGESFSFLLQKNGRVSVFPFADDENVWRRELLGWLKSWIVENGLAEALLKEANFCQVGRKSYAVSTPGVPQKINIRVKGVASFKTDPTPYPEGTSEVEIEPDFIKRLASIEARLDRLTSVVEKFSLTLERLSGVQNQEPKRLDRDYSV
jgi:hypothetical protein